jgi:hypothetical protein
MPDNAQESESPNEEPTDSAAKRVPAAPDGGALGKELKRKPGDQVFALRNVDLKVGQKTVRSVRKGEKLTVEQVQGNLLGVRNGKTRGWIDNKAVIDVGLMAWYKRLPNYSSVEKADRTRGKFDGLLCEIMDAGSKPLPNFFGSGSSVNGQPIPSGGGTYVNSQNVGIFLRKAGGSRRELLLAFPGSRNIFPNISALKSYGMVEPADYVAISTDDQQVLVNGERRTPREG